MRSRQFGQVFEQRACEYLNDEGVQVLYRNYVAPLIGEIDIIAQDGDTLIFVEVKARKSSSFGQAVEMVTQSKQNKLIKTAWHFLQHHHQFSMMACRFDVIGFDIDDKDIKIDWIQGAFWLA